MNRVRCPHRVHERIAYSRHLGTGVGTMGVSLIEFVPMWSLIMAQRMLLFVRCSPLR